MKQILLYKLKTNKQSLKLILYALLALLIIISLFNCFKKESIEDFFARPFHKRRGVVRNVKELQEWAEDQDSRLNYFCEDKVNKNLNLEKGQNCQANCHANPEKWQALLQRITPLYVFQ